MSTDRGMDKKRCGAHTEENATQPCKRTKCHFWQRGRTWRLHQVKQLTKKKTTAAWKRFYVESKTRHTCPDLRNRRTHRAQTRGCRGRRAWRTHWSAGRQRRALTQRDKQGPYSVGDQSQRLGQAMTARKVKKLCVCVCVCVCARAHNWITLYSRN